jgi:hypothetical protein
MTKGKEKFLGSSKKSSSKKIVGEKQGRIFKSQSSASKSTENFFIQKRFDTSGRFSFFSKIPEVR